MPPSSERTGNTVTAKRCKCGSTTHSRSSHKDCPLNKKANSISAGSTVSNTISSDNVWKYHKEVDEYVLEWEADTVDTLITERFKRYLVEVRERCEVQIGMVSLPDSLTNCKEAHFFLTAAEDLLQKLKGYMQKSALKLGIEPIQDWEFFMWLGMSLFCDPVPGELSFVYKMMQLMVADDACTLLTVSRVQEIHQCVTTIDPSRANYRQDWQSMIDDVDRMRVFEESIFKRSLEMCFSRNMCLVFDDELVGCRSKSVQSRVLSNRKRGKDGIKNDALACSLTRILYSIRHKQRINYSQFMQVKELISELTESRDVNGITVAADRGYSNKKLWQYLASVNLGFVMVTNKGPGAGHPFKSQSDLNKATLENAVADTADVVQAVTRSSTPLSQTNGLEDSQPQENLETAMTQQDDLGVSQPQENLETAMTQQDDLGVSQTQENLETAMTQQDDLDDSTSQTDLPGNHCGVCKQICTSQWVKKCLKCKRAVHNICSQQIGLPESVIGCAVCFVKAPKDPIWNLSESRLLFAPDNIKKLRDEIRLLVAKQSDILNEKRNNHRSTRNTARETENVDVEFEKGKEDDDEEPPPENQKPCIPTSNARTDVVDNSPLLGRQILVAEQSYQTRRVGEANKQKVWGIAYRDYNTAKNTETNVVRLTLSKPGKELEYFAKTLVLKRFRVPKNTDTSLVLFFPSKSAPQKTRNMQSFLKARSVPITCWQRSTDWFLARMFVVTGTAGHKLANQDDEARKLLHKNPEQGKERMAQFGDEEAAAYLRQRWVFPRNISTEDMKSGSMNEDSVLNALRKQGWCLELYECGLFVALTLRCMAVSPDGVTRVRHPDTDVEVVASVEIKTRFADHMINTAQNCASKYGYYFSCTVGDNRWWEVIPSSNRAQILHQAAVLNLDYVLYCSATHTSLTMTCLVYVSPEQRNIYSDAIKKWEHLMNFALDTIGQSAPPPQPHPAFSTEDSYILNSHFRVWSAFRKLVLNNGNPIYPVYIIKCAAQVFYNKLKGGVDGSTQFVSALTGQASKELPMDLSKRLATRSIKQVLVNSFLMWRISQVAGTDMFHELSLNRIREKLNNCGSVNMFAYRVGIDLVRYAASMKQTPIVSSPTVRTPRSRSHILPSPGTIQRAVSKNKFRSVDLVKQFNNGDHKRLRLGVSSEVKHLPLSLGRKTIHKGANAGKKRFIQKTCAYCKGQTTYVCSDCGVALHHNRTNTNASSTTCWQKWHTKEKLPIPN